MIKLLYPTGEGFDLSSAAVIELDYQWTGGYPLRIGDYETTIPMMNDKIFVNIASDGTFNGSRPNLFKTESLNVDEIHQRSNRYDYLNLYDTVNSSNLPRLSSGRVEQPCHHESVTGTININPDVTNPSVTFDDTKLYPMAFSFFDETRIGWSASYNHVVSISGICLGRMTKINTSTSGIHQVLTPYCWISMEYNHYKWYAKKSSTIKSFADAKRDGTMVVEKTICTPSYVATFNLPTLYFKDISPMGTSRVKMYGEKVFGVYYNSQITQLSAASSLTLPNIDALKRRLLRDIPVLRSSIASRVKYPDEIWYNLILAGAKEIKRLDMNNIANLLEIPGMIRVFDRIYNQFISFKNGSKVYKNPTTGKIIKKASCIYLGIHYGIKLTVMDLKEIVKTFHDNPSLLRQLRRRVVSYSRTTSGKTIYNCKSCMSPKSGREITDIRDLSRILGLELSALNLWDLVPWSFVVDWFIPISDILDSFENIARLESTYDLEYLIETVSHSEDIVWENHTLHVKIYDRYITDHMPEFGFTVGDASGLNNHVIEASALIINSVR